MKLRYILMTFVMFLIAMATTVRGDWYVATNGSDSNSGQDIDNPLLTIDQLFTNLTQGSGGVTAYIRGGTYIDTDGSSYSDTLTNDVIITNYNDEIPILTTALSNFDNPTWVNVSSDFPGLNVWNFTYSSSATKVYMYQNSTEETLYVYENLADMGDSDFPDYGTWWDNPNDIFFIRLDAGLNPNNIAYLSTRSDYCLRFATSGATVTVDGLTLRGCQKGVYSTTGDKLSINNTYIKMSRWGLDIRDNSNVTANNNTIEMLPIDDWDWEYMKNYHASMESAGIKIHDTLDGTKVIWNDVSGFFNGILMECMSIGKCEELEVGYNTVYNIDDDALEFEDYLWSANIHHNNVSHAYVGISFSPTDSSQGITSVNYNLLIANRSKQQSTGGATYHGECFKILDSDPMTTINVSYNTCYGNRTIYAGAYTNSQEDNLWNNNIFVTRNSRVIDRSGLASDGNIYDFNIYYSTEGVKIFKYWNNDTDSSTFTLAEALVSGHNTGNWDLNSLEIDPIFNNITVGDFRPVNGSLACTMSSTGSYVGAFPCVANVTEEVSNTTGQWNTQTVLSNETITMNLTFTQPPYIVSSNLSVNLTSIVSYVNTSTADSVTTLGSIANPANSNDNNYDTYAQGAGGQGATMWIYHNYTGSNNDWYNGNTYVYWKSAVKGYPGNYIILHCWNGASWTEIASVPAPGNAFWSIYTRTNSLPESCIDGSNDIQLAFELQHYIGPTTYGTRVYDLEIFREYNHYAHIENYYIYNTSNETARYEEYNVTSLVQNQSNDNIVYFTFGSYLNMTIEANVTVDYIYNKSMIFNVFDQLTSGLMNVTCTFNNASLGRNETFNTTFVSYDENIFRCSEPGYVNTSYEVGYPFDEVNMTMERPQAFECAGLPNEALAYNFTVYDEDNWTILYGNDIYIDLTFGSSILSFEKANTSFLEICIANGQSYEVDGFLQLENGYVTKYFLRSATFDNVTNEIRVFEKESITAYSDLVITLRDSSFLPYSTAIGRMQRYYPANHSWITVQQDDSDQFGQVFYSIIEKDVEYRFLFYINTTLVSSTEKIKLICDDGLCRVSFQIVVDEDDQSDLNIVTALDSTLRVIDVNWTDATGETASLRVLVTKETMTGTIGICDSSLYSSTGAYQCNVSDYTGGLQLKVYTPATDDIPTINELLTLADVGLGDYLSITQSAFWSFVILLLFIGVGLVSPVAVIIFTMFGVFVISLLGINPVVDVMFLVVAGVMGVAIGAKVKK